MLTNCREPNTEKCPSHSVVVTSVFGIKDTVYYKSCSNEFFITQDGLLYVSGTPIAANVFSYKQLY